VQDGESLWKLLWRQISTMMAPVLIAVALISLALKDYEDVAAVGVIMLLMWVRSRNPLQPLAL
jgi:magnesium-transporting ATPase (P-type)